MAYASLPCGLSGAGRAILASPVGPTETTVRLLDGEDAFLPTLADSDWYYGILRNPCGTCETVKVVATPVADTLTIVRIAATTACFPIGSTVQYDGSSVAAINAMVSGQVISTSSPIRWNKVTGALSLDLEALQKSLPGLIQTANLPLSYDNQSGVLALDEDRLVADITEKVQNIARSAVSAASPLTYDSSTGEFGIDIATLKTDLGITTT